MKPQAIARVETIAGISFLVAMLASPLICRAIEWLVSP